MGWIRRFFRWLQERRYDHISEQWLSEHTVNRRDYNPRARSFLEELDAE